MTTATASAPGKIVISGEYAVLDGAPAIAMAVDRRAVAAITSDGRAALTCEGLGGDVDRGLLDSVQAVVQGPGDDDRSFLLDTRAFAASGDGPKLGIGSSAALTVALLRALAPELDTRELLARARRAHCHFQGGVGSGVDIATSATGGLLHYRRDGNRIESLHWPAKLHFALFWSGVAASTSERISRLGRTKPMPSRDALAQSAKAAADAWRSADAEQILSAMGDYVPALSTFSVDHDLGIFEAGHDERVRDAESLDVVYKPCGAGGGDIGIAMATDTAALAAFAARATDAGFTQLELALDPDGVSVSHA